MKHRTPGYPLAVPAPASRIGAERIGDSVAVIEIEGEHDLQNAPTLQEELNRLLEEGLSVVVDLSAATFVDSSVLATLIDGRRAAERLGLGFVVALPDSAAEAVGRVIQVTGLDKAMPISASREEAAAAAAELAA